MWFILLVVYGVYKVCVCVVYGLRMCGLLCVRAVYGVRVWFLVCACVRVLSVCTYGVV